MNLQEKQLFCFCIFISPVYTFFWRGAYLFTRQVKVQKQIGKIIPKNDNIKVGMPTLAGNRRTHASISSMMGRVFSIFRQKMDGDNPSEMDIKVFFTAPTYCLQTKVVYTVKGNLLNILLVNKNGIKYKLHGFNMNLILLNAKMIFKRKIFVTLVLTSSFFTAVCQSLLFRDGENVVALLVYS